MLISDDNLIWIDLEMTGLDPDRHRIIEIATLVTDKELNILSEGPVLAIRQLEEDILAMDLWNVRVHTSTGLIDRVRKSCINEEESSALTLDFLRNWVPEGKSPICGNSIAQDRRFLFRYMPELEAYFHYRYLDVSTVRELVRRWKPDILSGYQLYSDHTALNDIRKSVAELIHYREHFIRL
ncbi:oligoribonuclease [Blochmannia endosymbiont of Polyrhachis (Hedomyrma) turneri]|uniref:oligoribonuclease n=1 Tax=Blochmannia endosymbiont of Polyrhachis (Hedomyrma) turneri TaxID=1505596 RepID=UPI00061A7E0C|nr:oligoribonuclease [Blochmannia endosymbiont of Polyrhachis (Hedomyrma) turneri]AKC59663.1 Oligoribonuclease [Blochmannia endosymbiont of Polyrhachis (Hedomyrma) turneri]